MKKICLLVTAIFLLVACKDPNENNGNSHDYPSTATVIRNAVKDKDGNKYDAVRIGDQVWMASNLKTTHYADGTEIPLHSNNNTHDIERYYPDNNEYSVETYGYLYSLKAVLNGQSYSDANPSGVQGICPNGWHVPSRAEWEQLEQYVRANLIYVHDSITLPKALSSDKGVWRLSKCVGSPGFQQSTNNTTGFSAVPAGCYVYRNEVHDYNGFGTYAFYWSSSSPHDLLYEDDDEDLYDFHLYYEDEFTVFFYTSNQAALSVRCLRD